MNIELNLNINKLHCHNEIFCILKVVMGILFYRSVESPRKLIVRTITHNLALTILIPLEIRYSLIFYTKDTILINCKIFLTLLIYQTAWIDVCNCKPELIEFQLLS